MIVEGDGFGEDVLEVLLTIIGGDDLDLEVNGYIFDFQMGIRTNDTVFEEYPRR